MSYNKDAYEYSVRDNTNFRAGGSSSSISTATVTVTSSSDSSAEVQFSYFSIEHSAPFSELQNYAFLEPHGEYLQAGETKTINGVALWNGTYVMPLPPNQAVTTEGNNYSVDYGALFITGDCELTMIAFADNGDGGFDSL